jgi:hypothetical protein
VATQNKSKPYGGTLDYVYLASAARTSTPAVDDVVVPYGKTLTVIINITTGAATPNVTPAIVGVTDAAITYTILTGAAITSTSAAVVVLRAGDGVADVANLGTSIPLPKTFRITMTHGDADSLTYSITIQVR